MSYYIALSLFQVLPIAQIARRRFNLEAFNTLNIQEFHAPDATDCTESLPEPARRTSTPVRAKATVFEQLANCSKHSSHDRITGRDYLGGKQWESLLV
jgi:hypothetical protein